MKRLLIGGLAYALFVTAVAVAYVAWEHWPRRSPFPIDGSGDFGGSQALEPGRPLTWGTVILRNLGSKPVIVERVRLLRATPNIVYLSSGTHRVGEDHAGEDEIIIGGEGLWASPYIVRPLAEQNLVPVPRTFSGTPPSPDQALQIVFGIQLDQPGIGGVRDVEVTMRVGHRRHTEVYHHELYLCAPLADYQGPNRDHCPSLPQDGAPPIPERVLG